jgi:superkiller protein 3
MLALSTGDAPLAEKHLRAAFDVDPRWADVPLQLAKALLLQDKTDAAVETLNAYLKVEPNDAEAWSRLGQAYQRLGEFEDAKRCHLKAIDVDSEYFEAYYGVAMALRELGGAEEAREYLVKFREMRAAMTETVRTEKAEATDEDFKRRAVVDLATQAGAVYAMHKCFAEAEQCWLLATSMDPLHIECQEMLSRLRPNDTQRLVELGYAYIEGGRAGDAEAPFQQAIELAPQNAAAYTGLAQMYMLLGEDVEKAAELAETAVKLEPTAPNYFVLAATRERLQDWPGAAAALERAIELDPTDPDYEKAYEKLRDEHGL